MLMIILCDQKAYASDPVEHPCSLTGNWKWTGAHKGGQLLTPNDTA
jgi:hypothetical protein